MTHAFNQRHRKLSRYSDVHSFLNGDLLKTTILPPFVSFKRALFYSTRINMDDTDIKTTMNEIEEASTEHKDNPQSPQAVRQFERHISNRPVPKHASHVPSSSKPLCYFYRPKYGHNRQTIGNTHPSWSIRGNPSMAQLVFDAFGCVDKMIVHRPDMNTSGIVVYARTEEVFHERP